MDNNAIREATRLARMFARQAEVVLNERASPGVTAAGTRASGTLRRLSLDLTRALADMRKPT